MAPPPATKNFQQHQPITTLLRGICEAYPAENCLRELLQNADDAGATEIEYVLDTHSYTDGPLLCDGLVEYHGPALLVRNNSVFKDADFKSLSSVGDSRKRHDASSTGKFGQGFNSVYHWTDGPWIYSRNWLLFLDPQESWSTRTEKPGGPAWDVVKNRDCIEIQNHLKTFRVFDFDTFNEIKETVIRIPLRTKSQAMASKIVERETTTEEIGEALNQFGQEIQEGGLLFLKHIQKLIIRIDDKVILQARILEEDTSNSTARRELPSNFKEMYTPMIGEGERKTVSKIFHMHIEVTVGGNSTIYRYLVHHIMIESSGQRDLDAWARKQKLFPWVAVAASLNQKGAFIGRLFSTLRLPILTRQPIHIHGLWSITPDRGRLSSSGQSPDFENFATKWNEMMFTRVVTSAWVGLLLHCSSISWNAENFRFWPRIAAGATELWAKLDDNVIKNIVREELPVWPTASGCIMISHGLVSVRTHESIKYASALEEAKVPAVYLEESMFDKLQQYISNSDKIQLLSSRTVRDFLRTKHASTALPDISSPLLKLLLEYCVLDADQEPSTSRRSLYNNLCGITFWPTMNGMLAELGKSDLLLPRSGDEAALFSEARRASTIDVNRLTEQTLKSLRADIDDCLPMIRYRTLIDLTEDWPVIYPTEPQLRSVNSWLSRTQEHDQMITTIWTWICARFKEEKKIPSRFHDLWLLPINNSRLCRVQQGAESQSLLIVSPHEQLFVFLNDLLQGHPEIPPPILDSVLLPAGSVKILRKIAKSDPKLRLACPDDLESLLEWLVAARGLLQTASIRQKRIVLEHVEKISMTTSTSTSIDRNTALATHIRSLPFFSKISSSFPFQERTLVMRGLDSSGHVFEAPEGLPPLPEIVGLSFYDLTNTSERFLVQTFGLFDHITLPRLLERHLLPWAVAAEDDSVKTAKEALIDFVLDRSHRPTEEWLTNVFSFPIIPTPFHTGEGGKRYRCLSSMVAPTSSLSTLYFESEDVFPCPEFFERHKEALSACGIKNVPNWQTILERVRFYSQCDVNAASLESKTKSLVQIPIHTNWSMSKSSIDEIRTLKWLPATSNLQSTTKLLSPQECRGAEESCLIDHIWGTVCFSVGKDWKEILGWSERIELDVLLRQLDCCLEAYEHTKIDKVLEYLQAHFEPTEIMLLKNKSFVLGAKKSYLTPDETFTSSKLLTRYPMAPYLDEVDVFFSANHRGLLSQLGVRPEPCVRDILKVQRAIKSCSQGPLDEPHLNVIIASLEIGSRISEGKEIPEFLIPDTGSLLRELPDIVYGDLGVTSLLANFNFTHPAISADLIKRIGVEGSLARATKEGLEIEEDDEDEYTPHEQLTTIISDTLGRYPIDSTFDEFLANADDCCATKMSWVLDKCPNGPYESSQLLTDELAPLQGPALFAYNNEVFSEKDFAGFKDIGQGGKSNDVTTTGMFGRGALSMYHFTDSPSIISGDTFLILDPQQELLPRNRRFQRMLGVKIPLERARRVCHDQLIPFDDLCGFSMNEDYYCGTLFRFPFRISPESSLTEALVRTDSAATAKLLESYFLNARKSLLFLRHVDSIDFRVRGEKLSQWSVSTNRSGQSENDIFRRLTITTTKRGQAPKIETWHVGITDIDQTPTGLFNPGRGAQKIAECGVAACTSSSMTTHDVFCRLPLPSSNSLRLPVSIHATFAITGDRRTIPWEDKDNSSARWNHWLLTTCIPDFYVELLKDLTPKLGVSIFNFWPTASGSASKTLSGVVTGAIWGKIMDQQHSSYGLYPIGTLDIIPNYTTATLKRASGKSRKLHSVTSIKLAQFDLLPEKTSSRLRPLLVNLCPTYVRPPTRTWQNFITAAATQEVTTLSPSFLCRLFRLESNCVVLEEFLLKVSKSDGLEGKNEVIQMLLQYIVPCVDGDLTSLNILEGCRILPMLDGSMGLLSLETDTKVPLLFVVTEEEQKLFAFASHLIVHTEIFLHSPALLSLQSLHKQEAMTCSNPISEIMKGTSNMRQLEVWDIGLLMAEPQSPVNTLLSSPDRLHEWILTLWSYINKRFRDISDSETPLDIEALLSRCRLQDQPIYQYFDQQWNSISPRQFESGRYLIEPINKAHSALYKEIGDLQIVDRDTIPYLLQETGNEPVNCSSFLRLTRVLLRIYEEKKVPVNVFLAKRLSKTATETLKNLLLKYLTSSETIPINSMLQRLPVWPLHQHEGLANTLEHVPAEGACFCGSSKMLLPWVTRSLGTVVDPKLVKKHAKAFKALGVHVMSVKQVWENTCQHLPKNLENINLADYLGFVQELRNNQIVPRIAIAPNGFGVLCNAGLLYDPKDEFFQAAFRQEPESRFLHADMFQNCMRDYWISMGLRCRRKAGGISPNDYVQCALAIEARRRPTSLLQSHDFYSDADKVASYLLWDTQSFRTWHGHIWKQISTVQMFRVQDEVSAERFYRQRQMLQVAQRQHHCSLVNASKKNDIRILWSQLPILKNAPTAFVFENMPNGGSPSTTKVFAHLTFLISICASISDYDTTEYLKDVQASYAFLQENLGSAKLIPGIREARVWFNMNTIENDTISAVELQGALTSASLLCLNSPVDAGIIRVSRKFLVPYERLLKVLGCKSVIQPSKVASRVPSNNAASPLELARRNILGFRDHRQFVDVVFEAEGQELPAHRVFLAAVSDYCKAQFSGEWGNLLGSQPRIHIADIRFNTLSQMVDFAYTGKIEWPRVHDQGNNEEIAEKLDELLDLLQATDRWLLESLHTMTEDHLLEHAVIYVRPDNVESVKVAAEAARASSLVNHCAAFLAIADNVSFVEATRSM